MFLNSQDPSNNKIVYLFNQLTDEEIKTITAQNFKFINNLSGYEIEQLWGDNLEKSIETDLKELESRLDRTCELMNLSENKSPFFPK